MNFYEIVDALREVSYRTSISNGNLPLLAPISHTNAGCQNGCRDFKKYIVKINYLDYNIKAAIPLLNDLLMRAGSAHIVYLILSDYPDR